jgi:ABC-type spermidine/putrescine transport system permease subunit I
MVFGWSIGAFAEPAILGSLNEQRSLAVTIYERGVVRNDYGLSSTMGIVLLAVAFIVTYFSLRYSRGALAA